MDAYIYLTVYFYVYYLNCLIVCNKNADFAFTGCNASFEWNFGNNNSSTDGIAVRIKDTRGDVIIATINDQCMVKAKISVSCEILQRKGDWIMLLDFINISTKHNGSYTAMVIKGLNVENETKQLVVIDKPQVRGIRKPVLHETFAVICSTSYASDCLNYIWKVNGTYLHYTSSVHANSSILTYSDLTMMDTLSKLQCQVDIDNCGYMGCNCCSEDSEPYIIIPYYGPYSVVLNRRESDIFLMENENCTVKCSADCYPICMFRWESLYINIGNEELFINSFNSKMAGEYICIAINRETGMMAKSRSVFLHLKKSSSVPGANQDIQSEQSWIWPVIVFFFLLFVGMLLFFKHWRKDISRTVVVADSRNLNEAPKHRKPQSIRRSTHGSKLVDLFTNEESDVHNCIQSGNLNNTQQESRGPQRQEDMYSTIEDTALSNYTYAGDDVTEVHSDDTARTTKYQFYDSAHSVQMYRVGTADVSITDENYLTPINDLANPIELCENVAPDLFGRDQSYITPINDSACEIEKCEIETCHSVDTEVLKRDAPYITPIPE